MSECQHLHSTNYQQEIDRHRCLDCGAIFRIPEIKQLAYTQAQLDAAVEAVAKAFDKGVVEGRATQAILEIQGRDRFVAELKEKVKSDRLAAVAKAVSDTWDKTIEIVKRQWSMANADAWNRAITRALTELEAARANTEEE